jgi:hypothetical protein
MSDEEYNRLDAMGAWQCGPTDPEEPPSIEALVSYLRDLRTNSEYAKDEYGDYHDENGESWGESSPAADIARKWARELLKAAEANGWHGCPLCRS